MRHDWILEVLDDLRRYAAENGLTATAAKAEEALKIARLEIGKAEGTTDPDDSSFGGSSGGMPRGRPN